MDTYLPAEFFELRDDLNDWRDASPCGHVQEKAGEPRAGAHCADPSWRVI